MQCIIPQNMDELVAALGVATEKSKVIAGGTDFIIKERAGKFEPDLLIYPGAVPELGRIIYENGYLRIGAMVSMNQLNSMFSGRSELRAIADAASDVGSPQIRTKATMIGNLCNASPAGDMLPIAWLYDARLEVLCADGTQKKIPVCEYIVGPQKTVLAPQEMVTAVIIDTGCFEGCVSAFHKIGSRERVSISREGLAAVLRVDEDGIVQMARLVLGAVGGTPIHVLDAEAYMMGRKLDDTLVSDITPMVAHAVHENCRPMNRLYKTEAARGLTADTFRKLRARV